MRQLIVVIVMLFTGSICWGQSRDEKRVLALRRADSAHAAQAVKAVNNFELSITDKEKIAAAAIKAGELRRAAIKNYIKTASFQKEFNYALQYQDSVYMSVLGKEKFMQFKATEMRRRDAFESAQRQRHQRQLDSLSILKLQKNAQTQPPKP